MIFTRLRSITAYRMHQPVWATRPTSGAGAGRHGGRANRPGVDALYLALDEATAIAEYRQLSSLLPPGTLVAYTLSVATVVDFTGGYTASWPPLWQEFSRSTSLTPEKTSSRAMERGLATTLPPQPGTATWLAAASTTAV